MASCKTEVQKQFSNANDLTIYFYTAEGTDSVYRIVHTTDEKAINKLIDFIDKGNVANKNCNYNGRIKFGQGSKDLGTVLFNTVDPACRLFSFTLNGKEKNTNMSNEAADFLIALRERRNFY